ncbi:MAG: GFA family protein [Gammaproteobacteria bacterium]
MHYEGQCCCENIKFEVQGEPEFTQYCHCDKCRLIAKDSENPLDKVGYGFTAAYLTKNFTITKGEKEGLTSIVKNNARLYSCSQCKSLIYGISEKPELQAAIGINMNNFQFSGEMPAKFKAVRHIWYTRRVIGDDAMNDGLPKFEDAPKEQGGTDKLFSADDKRIVNQKP